MTEEEKKKLDRRLMVFYIAMLVLLVAFMIIVGVTKKVDTLIYPVGITFFLVVYWVISDVLSIIWRDGFEGKTDEQKRSYYIYAGLDAIGLGGLIYFLVNMSSMNGAIVYVACVMLKRRFRDEFDGNTEGEPETAESGTGSGEPETLESGTGSSEPETAESGTGRGEPEAPEPENGSGSQEAPDPEPGGSEEDPDGE